LNKLFLFFFTLFTLSSAAQDSLSAAKKDQMVFTEKDIAIDSATIKVKHFRANFKNKYSEKEFIYEFKTPEKNAWDRFMQWLSNFLKSIFNFTDGKAAMKWAQILIQIFAFLIVLGVVYMIVKAVLNKDGQWIFGKNSDRKIINYNEIEKNLHLVDFEKLIASSLASDEKRLVIRYYYLWLLKKMTEKGFIKWDVEKTNSDYLNEIKNGSQKEEFAYLSYLYNNIWYGEFELDEAIFDKARKAFAQSIVTHSNG
jgi:hypothetical protein